MLKVYKLSIPSFVAFVCIFLAVYWQELTDILPGFFCPGRA